MSDTPTKKRAESRDLSARQIVLRMLSVIENSASTAQDRQRACSTIRDLYENPNRYGMSIAECELGTVATDSSVNRLAIELDSQEAAFAVKLRELMRSQAITQAELAARIGCTQPAISQMLNRKCRPQKNTILGLAAALNVNPRELWPDLDVTDILDTVAAVQQEQTMSEAEFDAIRRTLERPVAEAMASPLPKRKR